MDYPDRNCRNEEVRIHEASPYFVTSDWYPDYPDRNCRNEEVRTRETSPILHDFLLGSGLPRQELQK